MNDSALALGRQLKDGSERYYLWQPDPAAAFGGRILGHEVEIDENMPDISAGSLSIAFGNFKRVAKLLTKRSLTDSRQSNQRRANEIQFSKAIWRRYYQL